MHGSGRVRNSLNLGFRLCFLNKKSRTKTDLHLVRVRHTRRTLFTRTSVCLVRSYLDWIVYYIPSEKLQLISWNKISFVIPGASLNPLDSNTVLSTALIEMRLIGFFIYYLVDAGANQLPVTRHFLITSTENHRNFYRGIGGAIPGGGPVPKRTFFCCDFCISSIWARSVSKMTGAKSTMLLVKKIQDDAQANLYKAATPLIEPSTTVSATFRMGSGNISAEIIDFHWDSYK